MKKNYLLAILAMLCTFPLLYGQEKVTLSGHITDASTGEELIGANVFVEELSTGNSTNVYGFYSLSIPPGKYTLQITYIGFETKKQELNLQQDLLLDIELQPESQVIQEVIVTAKEDGKNVRDIEMSVEKLNMPQIKKIPHVLGEADLIRGIQLLPGVTTVGEGATGFNVRGGNVDQNLILLDEATVYNSSHVFGLFSVFNTDAIKDAKLYKGGIPAKYGGRLSSVLDVRQREGNMKRFGMSGGIGLISSRLTLEGPVQKDKSSFMVAGRSSYGHLFLKFDPNLKENVLYFFDLNAKVNYKLGKRDRLFLSGYFGKDVFNFGEEFASDWGNATGTLRWNHLFNERLFSNFTLIYSDYGYSFGIPEGAQAFDWTAKIVTYSLKGDFTYFFNPESQLDFGIENNVYRFHPGNAIGIGDETFFNEISVQHKHAIEPAVYIGHEQKFGDRLTMQYGIRYSNFIQVGEEDVFEYKDGIPTSEEDIIDTTHYNALEVIERYDGLEPRISANYLIDDDNSIKASYNRMRQYIHLVSNTTSATPIDIWTPSGKYIKPATVDQVAVGYFRNFKGNAFETSVEAYYKWFDNLLDYKDGAELLLNENLETELIQGQGKAYGLEFVLRKPAGRLTGFISYTVSRTERQVETINNGEWYPSNYDKLHDLSTSLSFDVNEKLNISANFAYMSGRPITYPDSRYIFDGITIPNYSNRNGARTPVYHRLDIAFNLYPKSKKNPNKRWKSEWNIGVYNIYGRKNPYSIYFRQNEDNPQVTEAVRLAVFGAPLPYVNYNFKF